MKLLLLAVIFTISQCRDDDDDSHKFVIFMGPPCSGKSSLIDKVYQLTGCAKLGLDLIVESQRVDWNTSLYPHYRIEAMRIMERQFSSLLEKRTHVICYETTGADHALQRLISMTRIARNKNYSIHLLYQTLAPFQLQRCLRRRNRVQRRQVSATDMKTLYFESSVNFERLWREEKKLFNSITAVPRMEMRQLYGSQ